MADEARGSAGQARTAYAACPAGRSTSLRRIAGPPILSAGRTGGVATNRVGDHGAHCRRGHRLPRRCGHGWWESFPNVPSCSGRRRPKLSPSIVQPTGYALPGQATGPVAAQCALMGAPVLSAVRRCPLSSAPAVSTRCVIRMRSPNWRVRCVLPCGRTGSWPCVWLSRRRCRKLHLRCCDGDLPAPSRSSRNSNSDWRRRRRRSRAAAWPSTTSGSAGSPRQSTSRLGRR